MVDACYRVPSAADSTYVPTLLDICIKEKVNIVMPFMSADLIPLIKYKSEFEALGTLVSVSDRESVEITNNKYRFYSFMKECG